VLTASAEATESDKKYLKGKIASSIGVQERNLRDFAITSSPNRRLTQTSLRQRRELLATYSWTASFDVVLSLADTGSSLDSEFATSIASSLTDNDFISEVASQVGAQVDASSLVTVLITRQPTLYPSNSPTLAPTSSASSEGTTSPVDVVESSAQEASAGSDDAGHLIFGTIAGLLGLGLMSIAAYCYYRIAINSAKVEEFEEAIEYDADGQQDGHKSMTSSAGATEFHTANLPSAKINKVGAKKSQESSLPDVLKGSHPGSPQSFNERKAASKEAAAHVGSTDLDSTDQGSHSGNLTSIVFETLSRADSEATTTETVSFMLQILNSRQYS